MREDKFYELMGEIDPEIIAAADKPVPFRQKRGFKIALIAAVLAFAMLLTPVAVAFALAVGYIATHDQVNDGSEPQDPTRGDAQQDFTPGGLVGELLGGIDWGALKDTVGADGNVNWKDFFAVLQGTPSETVGASGHAFQAVKLDDGTMKITKFVNNGNETIVEIPETISGAKVTVIGEKAFAYNETITHVSIPDSITKIETEAFYYCTNLITVDMSDNVRSIGDGAFEKCASLTTINLPYALKSIGELCFAYCPNLSGIVIRPTLTDWGENAFSGSLKSVTILDGVTEIHAGAFTDSLLQEVTIPSSVISIGAYAFSLSPYLKHITLNEGLESIGSAAFDNTPIQELVIPSTVTDMQDIYFTNCMNLERVIFRGDAPTVHATEAWYMGYRPEGIEYPYYIVHYFLGAQGFTEPIWHVFACDVMPCVTEQFVKDNGADTIPFFRTDVLGWLDCDTEDVTIIDTYDKFKLFETYLPAGRYDEAYFERFAIVLIKFTHDSGEEILGVAGLIPVTDARYFEVWPVITVDTQGNASHDDICESYLTAEILKSDIFPGKLYGSGRIYAYNVSTKSGSHYHDPLYVEGK